MIKCIVNCELGGDLPDGAIELINELMNALEDTEIRPHPSLINLAVSDDPDEDEWKCELEVQIVPGVVLPVRCGSNEDEEILTNDQIVEFVVEGLAAVGPRLAAVVEVLHQARMDARKTLAGWHEDAAQVRLIDVGLAPYDHWRGMDVPALELVLEGLGDDLEPAIVRICVDSPSALATELQHERSNQQILAAKRRLTMEHGASGTIDQLAINVMTQAGQLYEDFQLLRRGGIFWLPDETCISIRRGHVTASSGDDDAHVLWMGSEMVVRRTFVPEPLLAAAVGRPVSELYQHDYLTPDMIVEEARCKFEEGEFALQVRFRQRTHMFCMVTGRTWPGDELTAGDQDASGGTSDTPPLGIAAEAL